MSDHYQHADCDKAIIEERLDDACEDCRNHMFKPPTPPDQPEDWIDEVVLKPAQWDMDDYFKAKAFILAKQLEAVQAAKLELIDQVFELSPEAIFRDWKPTDAFTFYERLKALDAELKAQPPVVIRDATKNSAADTTKQGEGESDE